LFEITAHLFELFYSLDAATGIENVMSCCSSKDEYYDYPEIYAPLSKESIPRDKLWDA